MSKAVLIADDDPDDREIFCEALANVDPLIECCHASDGEEVFQILRKQNQPAAIFLDINMPAMDGWECLELLRRNDNYRDTPIFIYSTSNLVMDMNKALDLGATAFISKPSSFKKVEGLLKSVIEAVHIRQIDKLSEQDEFIMTRR